MSDKRFKVVFSQGSSKNLDYSLSERNAMTVLVLVEALALGEGRRSGLSWSDSKPIRKALQSIITKSDGGDSNDGGSASRSKRDNSRGRPRSRSPASSEEGEKKEHSRNKSRKGDERSKSKDGRSNSKGRDKSKGRKDKEEKGKSKDKPKLPKTTEVSVQASDNDTGRWSEAIKILTPLNLRDRVKLLGERKLPNIVSIADKALITIHVSAPTPESTQLVKEWPGTHWKETLKLERIGVVLLSAVLAEQASVKTFVHDLDKVQLVMLLSQCKDYSDFTTRAKTYHDRKDIVAGLDNRFAMSGEKAEFAKAYLSDPLAHSLHHDKWVKLSLKLPAEEATAVHNALPDSLQAEFFKLRAVAEAKRKEHHKSKDVEDENAALKKEVEELRAKAAAKEVVTKQATQKPAVVESKIDAEFEALSDDRVDVAGVSDKGPVTLHVQREVKNLASGLAQSVAMGVAVAAEYLITGDAGIIVNGTHRLLVDVSTGKVKVSGSGKPILASFPPEPVATTSSVNPVGSPSTSSA